MRNKMTPKEKAEELFDKMYEYAIFDEAAKQCALIAVDEIIDNIIDDDKQILNYWQEVKQSLQEQINILAK